MEEARRAAAAQLARLAELNRKARKRSAGAGAGGGPASTDYWRAQAASEEVARGKARLSADKMSLRSTASKGKSKAREMGTYGSCF